MGSRLDTYVERGSEMELSCNLAECMNQVVECLGFPVRNFPAGLKVRSVAIRQTSDGSILATADFRIGRFISARGTK